MCFYFLCLFLLVFFPRDYLARRHACIHQRINTFFDNADERRVNEFSDQLHRRVKQRDEHRVFLNSAVIKALGKAFGSTS